MKVKQVLFSPGLSSYYFDDQTAIKSGAHQDGFVYKGNCSTAGFTQIRQAGECISVMLLLEDGSVAQGDCAAVQYSGVGGRDPLFTEQSYIHILQQHLKPVLEGMDIRHFRTNSELVDTLIVENKPLHSAVRYGVTQALLDATALHHRCLKTEVICKEYDLPIVTEAIPLFGQSGDDRYTAVDKMILKQVDALPHALINSVSGKLGQKGEKLYDYVEWLAKRILELRQNNQYQPSLHIDVYGTIGTIFQNDTIRIADYIAQLQDLAEPFNLYIEGPIDAGQKNAQIDAMSALKNRLYQIGSTAKLVADEWCNTYQDIVDFADSKCCHMVQIKTPDLGGIHNVVDAVLHCKKRNIQAYQGGTCNETDISAKTSVHLALASRPERMLVKPGMGFDEGMTIVNNEMQRVLSILRAKNQAA